METDAITLVELIKLIGACMVPLAALIGLVTAFLAKKGIVSREVTDNLTKEVDSLKGIAVAVTTAIDEQKKKNPKIMKAVTKNIIGSLPSEQVENLDIMLDEHNLNK